MTAVVFSDIYATNFWRGGKSRSGKGSELDATQVIRAELPGLLARLDVRSMLDAPCGDYHWMQTVDLGGAAYIGADIVPDMIRTNQDAHPGVDFRILDLCRDPLPKVDLIFCRDCLVHLSNELVTLALANIRASGATWFMATTFPGRENRKIKTGQWRAINLQAAPFGLSEPTGLVNEECSSDNGAFTDKSMGLWRVEW